MQDDYARVMSKRKPRPKRAGQSEEVLFGRVFDRSQGALRSWKSSQNFPVDRKEALRTGSSPNLTARIGTRGPDLRLLTTTEATDCIEKHTDLRRPAHFPKRGGGYDCEAKLRALPED